MRVLPTDLPGVLLIEPDVYQDQRGFFLETYQADRYSRHGICDTFVQDNYSRSLHATIRGLHLQVRFPQAKLIRVVLGEIYDVAVDVRQGSPTFGRWVGIVLNAESFRQSYVPKGFAHGFAVLSDVAEVEYKCSRAYDPTDEIGIAWNDPSLAIAWPVSQPVLSPRDRSNPPLADIVNRLPAYSATNL